jgi:hypothetical protein
MRFKFRVPLLLVVMAVGALGVSAASASAHEFLAAKYPVEVFGETTNQQGFEIAGATSVCMKATFSTNEDDAKNPTGPTATLLIHPRYENCEVTLGGRHVATVNTTGCNYVFHAAAELTASTVDVECLSGHEIEVTVSGITGCVIKVPAQTGLKTVEYMNNAGVVEVKVNVTNITWSATTGCGLATSSGTNGIYRQGELSSTISPRLTSPAADALGFAEGFVPGTETKIHIDVI